MAPPSRPKSKEKLAHRLTDKDAATRATSMMVGSKSGLMIGPEPEVVVEPAGLSTYTYYIHKLLVEKPLRMPQELRKTVFEEILEMKLDSRHEVFRADSEPEPFMFVDQSDP
jgi:hypothetical protein